MTNRSEILLTATDLSNMREEDKKLDEQIRQLQQKRSEVRRRLEAAEIIASASTGASVESVSPPANGHDTEEPSDSAAVLLCEELRRTGDSLKVRQIKERLIKLGFGEKFTAQPTFHYGLVYRLCHAKPPKLIRRGTKYKVPPLSSPEGETEAVGASVRH